MTSTAAIRNKCKSLSTGETAAAGLAKQVVLSRTMPNAARTLNLPNIQGDVASTQGGVKALNVRRQDHGLKVPWNDCWSSYKDGGTYFFWRIQS
jgi:hypothetical protein